jgi:hypothetical protein
MFMVDLLMKRRDPRQASMDVHPSLQGSGNCLRHGSKCRRLLPERLNDAESALPYVKGA